MLGIALVGGVLAGVFFARPSGIARSRVETVALLGIAGLFAVGTLDDLVARGPRGLLGHLRSLARGRPTTGILKLLAGVGAGVAAALAIGGSAVRVTAAAVLVATSVNLLNALDVRPGRALKTAGLVMLATLPTLWGSGVGAIVAAAVGAGAGVLPYDLRERSMLGDGGSNPLGFVVGLALALVLTTPWLVAAAAVALVLQVAAETVTLTRLIDAAPPLAWLDRLGRRPAPSGG
jgi:UDP-N-acetylmuramyl pentapeptide phosphotransferase/UDP-N-acetylglucosamine-1-phosphate transferase